MHVVIEIDENIYKRFMNNDNKERHQLTEKERFELSADAVRLTRAFCNGASLPKGHGRLIDADAFKKKVCTYRQTGCSDCKHSLCCPEDAPTIIEADKGSEDKE